MEGKLEGVNNYCIAVKEQGDDIVFLRKIVKGGADKSYGIQVAKLAGIPAGVLNRAHEIAEQLSNHDIAQTAKRIEVRQDEVLEALRAKNVESFQMSIFDSTSSTNSSEDIILKLREMDLSVMTPIDAMNELYKLQKKVKDRW